MGSLTLKHFGNKNAYNFFLNFGIISGLFLKLAASGEDFPGRLLTAVGCDRLLRSPLILGLLEQNQGMLQEELVGVQLN